MSAYSGAMDFTLTFISNFIQGGSPKKMTQGMDGAINHMGAKMQTLQGYANRTGLKMHQVREGFANLLEEPNMFFDQQSQKMFKIKNDMMNIGTSKDEISQMTGLDRDIYSTIMPDKATASAIQDNLEGMNKASGRFKFEYLSLMFAGMAVTGMFQGQINSLMELMGIFDMMNIMFTVLLLPILLDYLLPAFISLFKWITNLSAGEKRFLGWMILLVFVAGSFVMAISAIILGLSGLAAALGLGSVGGALLFVLYLFGAISAAILYIVVLIPRMVAEFKKIMPGWVAWMLALTPMLGVPVYGAMKLGKWANGTIGLANGGIVTRPTLAMIGENGPEAVVPLGNTFNSVNVDANVASSIDIDLLARRIYETLSTMNAANFAR